MLLLLLYNSEGNTLLFGLSLLFLCVFDCVCKLVCADVRLVPEMYAHILSHTQDNLLSSVIMFRGATHIVFCFHFLTSAFKVVFNSGLEILFWFWQFLYIFVTSRTCLPLFFSIVCICSNVCVFCMLHDQSLQ